MHLFRNGRTPCAAAILLAIGSTTITLGADCPPFYDSLNGSETVLANGGTINGPVQFDPALNGNGAHFSGNAYITYTGDLFAAARGSVSLWFKKNSPDLAGGILQVGQLGQPNSLGLFYNDTDTLYLEIRDSQGGYSAVSADNVLTESDYTHIAATWDDGGTSPHAALYVNGRYVDYITRPNPFVPSTVYMDVGRTAWYGLAHGVIDELTFSGRALLDSEVYAEYVYSSNRYVYQETGKPVSTGSVQLVAKTLLVDGLPFVVKGVGYQPVPIGYDISRDTLDHTFTDPCIIDRDIPLLRQMNVNTVRFWSQLPDSDVLLDRLYNNGDDPIYAIMGFWVPLSDIDYSDQTTIDNLVSEFTAYVNRFKGHPAVLAWAIGNENNLAYDGSLSDWYPLANTLAEAAYLAEGPAYHPTIVVNGGLLDLGDIDFGSDDASLPFVDMWGHNMYFGYGPHCYFEYYERISAKPVVITEYGIDAYDMNAGQEYQDVQADWVVQQWRHMAGKCVGGTIMAFSDEWWKAGDPDSQDLGGYYTAQHPDGYSNEEWWGIVSVSDNGESCDAANPRLVYHALQEEFAEPEIPTVSGLGALAIATGLLAAATLVITSRRRT